MSLVNLPNTADSLQLPNVSSVPSSWASYHSLKSSKPRVVHGIAMATRRARGSGSVVSAGTARQIDLESREGSPATIRSVPVTRFVNGSTQSERESERKPLLEEQRHAFEECWDFLKSLYELSSEGRDQLIAESSNPRMARQVWDSCWNLCICMRELEQANHASILPEHLDPTLRFSRLLIKALQSLEENRADSKPLLRASKKHNSRLLDAITSSRDDALNDAVMLASHLRYIHALLKAMTLQPSQLLDHIRGCWLLIGSIYGLLLTRQQDNDTHASSESMEQQQVVLYGSQDSTPEQLLATAIDAGMNLCNLFRHNWSLTRSGRTSPSKNGSTTSLHLSQYQISSGTTQRRPSHLSEDEDEDEDNESDMPSPRARGGAPHTPQVQSFPNSKLPDTPLTVFEDIDDPIDSLQETRRPGIIVLGQRGSVGHAEVWPPSASEVGEGRGGSRVNGNVIGREGTERRHGRSRRKRSA